MNRKIVEYPNQILRRKCSEIKEVTDDIKKLAQDLKEIMMKEDGIGLAAPQIGESKRLIAVFFEGKPEVFLNPKILHKSRKKDLMEEGCLSFPGLFLKISRSKEVELEFVDLAGLKKKMKLEGLSARVFQHEIDHLDGILFIDKMSLPKKLWRLLKN